MVTATNVRESVLLSGLVVAAGGGADAGAENGQRRGPWYIPPFPTAATDLVARDASANAPAEAQSAHAAKPVSAAPFKGRKVVESYDPTHWPYPREEAAEKEWDETEG